MNQYLVSRIVTHCMHQHSILCTCAHIDRPNHDLIYPIGVDFCLESNHSFPNNVTVQCRLDTRSRLTLLEISVTSLSVIKENMEVVSRGLEITLTQDDLSVLFEQDNAQVTVTCRARNDRQLVEDMRLTTIRVCGKCFIAFQGR